MYDVLHDILLEENLRDGLEVRAPHPETGEPLYSKIPSWVYQMQGWSRPDIRERVFDRVCKAFRIVPPFGARAQITHPVELASWMIARVAHARPPQPKHSVPATVKKFLDRQSRQPELGFLHALPPKQRTPLREAMRRMKQEEIDADFEFRPQPQGEDPEKALKHMYWLEMTKRHDKEMFNSSRRRKLHEQLVKERKERMGVPV